MKISMIVAASENGVIGRDGKIPWHISADLRRFKKLTMGHHLIMGRKTYESIGRPLPGRTNVILTRQENYSAPGCQVVTSLEEALELAKKEGEDEAFIGGGEGIYQAALPLADQVYFTRVHTQLEGDTFFPDLNENEWEEVEREKFDAEGKNPYPYTYILYRRKSDISSEEG